MSKKQYTVSGEWVSNYSITVEAEDEDEANSIAEQWRRENPDWMEGGEYAYHDVNENTWVEDEKYIYRPQVEEEGVST